MAVSVHIIATGARTPLGLRAASSAATLRAGISGMGEHPFMIDQAGNPMPGALDAWLDARGAVIFRWTIPSPPDVGWRVGAPPSR